MIPIAGFMPDADPTQEGVIIDSNGILPTLRNSFVSAPSALAANVNALSGQCNGLAELVLLDGSTRLIAGTDTALYELSGSTWTDRSRGAAYTSGTKTWIYGVFGNVVLATDKVDVLQASTAAGASFANVAGAPKMSVFDISQGFVMAGGTNEGTYGDQTDRWWCSGIYDYTVWTPAVATQCTTGRLVDVPGPITAMKAFGGDFIAYKEKGMFLGHYIGDQSPLVWQWSLIPTEVGVSSQGSVAVVPGIGHIIFGQDNIYAYAGSGIPRPIGDGIKNWLFNDLNTADRSNIKNCVDKVRGNVWFFYPRTDSASLPNGAVVYNYFTNKWGVWRGTVEAALEYLAVSSQWDNATGTWDAQTTQWNDRTWRTGGNVPAIVNTAHQVCTLDGPSGTVIHTFGDIGDDSQFSTLRRARMRFLSAPTSATMTNYYKYNEGESLTTGTSSTMVDGKFDFLRSARFHRLTLTTVGDNEFTGVAYDLQPDGTA